MYSARLTTSDRSVIEGHILSVRQYSHTRDLRLNGLSYESTFAVYVCSGVPSFFNAEFRNRKFRGSSVSSMLNKGTSIRVESETITNNQHTCTKRRETGCKLSIL